MTGIDPTPGVRLRPACAADARAIGALLDSLLQATPYAELIRSRLDVALRAPGGDAASIAATVLEEGASIRAIALHGFVAGAERAGMLHFVGVSDAYRRCGLGRSLVRASVDRLARDGARFVIAELPGEPRLRAGEALLREERFVVEARIPELYREGVDLVILRRWLRPG